MGTGKIDNAGPKYAFIDCKQLKEEGHGKVFIMKADLKDYQVGQTVKFTAYLDSQGRLQGKNLKSGLKGTKQSNTIKTIKSNRNVATQAKPTMFSKLKVAAKAKLSKTPVLKTLPKQQKPRDDIHVLGEYKGKVDNAGPKYGFVDCDALKRQGYDKVFVMRTELKEYKVGQTVKFTAYLDSLGRLQGSNLKSGLK